MAEKWGRTIYRLAFSDVCIAVTSEKGKQLFKESLSTEYMNCYFRLSCQITTQGGFACCGVSSLTVVLNALGVDPGINSKFGYRWYEEVMLDCCRSIEEIEEKGTSMYCLMCLAICNQLDGEFNRITEESCIEKFRDDVKFATMREDRVILICYGRKALDQVGEGHFAPVAGYNVENDMVLLLDVARFKYPPFWSKLTDVWRAMNTPDEVSGLNRGYMILWRADGLGPDVPTNPPFIFKFAQKVHQATPVFEEFGELLVEMKSFLLESVKEKTDEEILEAILMTFMKNTFQHGMKHQRKIFSPFMLQITKKQLETQFPDQEDVVKKLIQQINETALCQKIMLILPNDLHHLGYNCLNFEKAKTGTISVDINHAKIEDDSVISVHQYLTIFILSFPMDSAIYCAKNQSGTYYSFLRDQVENETGLDKNNTSRKTTNGIGLERTGNLLINEITQLRRQFAALMNFRESYSETL